MRNNRKELKALSILILVIVAFDIIRNIVEACINGIPQVKEVPDGMTKEMVQVSSVIAFALIFVVLIPQIYIGIKGINIANGGVNTKAHIIWSLILAVLSGVLVVSRTTDLIKEFNYENVMDVISPAIDVVMFAFYLVYARRVANECEVG